MATRKIAKAGTLKAPDLTSDQISLYNKLVDTYRKRAYNIAYRLTGNSTEAEDLTQEAFIKAYCSFNQYDPSLPFMGWMTRVVCTKFLDKRRRDKGHLHVSLDNPIHSEGEEDLTRELADKRPGPEALTLGQLSEKELLDLLKEVPDAYRTAVLLADLEDRSYEEIAIETGVSLGTVRSRIHRGRQAFLRVGRQMQNERSGASNAPTL